ncbi:hypothetical protein AMECASPLE_036717 [Ameca splendens]|uniref:Uncharacterized protein n=1 Tax=Ameca splendens TaxID=208324 RepID=A0ABV1A338_9TELE
MSLVQYCFLGVLQKELDEYKQLWNAHTIRPVCQSKCPSGKPEAMYHLPHSGRNCGFPASAQALSQFNTLMPTAGTPSDDDDEQENCFEELQRQSGLPPPLQWEAAVEIYITLKNMADL